MSKMGRWAITLAALMGAGAAQAANVGVSISIHEPGFHGRIELGRYPAPQVVVAYPPQVVVPYPPPYPPPMVVHYPPPVYRVPPAVVVLPPYRHRHWRDDCGPYQACGRPVVYRYDSRGPGYGRADKPHRHGHRQGHKGKHDD